MDISKIKNIVKEKYKKIAVSQSGCHCGCAASQKAISKNIGYSDQELAEAGRANMGLGCGNPVAISSIKKGDIVVDLGSGAGMDCILAARKVGRRGKIIGIDFTEEMIISARTNLKNLAINNVEFMLADIEELPLSSNYADIIISNCVINLAPDKDKVFKEILRVLKPGGRMYVSDIVLLAELTLDQKNDQELLTGCVAGALLKEDYLVKVKNAGFSQVKVITENKKISKQQYQGIALESLMIEAIK